MTVGRRVNQLELVFTPQGHAQLVRNDNILWSSDDDEDFHEEVSDELLGEADTDDVLDYLVNQGVISEKQAENVEVFEEYLEGDSDPDDLSPDEETGEFDDNE